MRDDDRTSRACHRMSRDLPCTSLLLAVTITTLGRPPHNYTLLTNRKHIHSPAFVPRVCFERFLLHVFVFQDGAWRRLLICKYNNSSNLKEKIPGYQFPATTWAIHTCFRFSMVEKIFLRKLCVTCGSRDWEYSFRCAACC